MGNLEGGEVVESMRICYTYCTSNFVFGCSAEMFLQRSNAKCRLLSALCVMD